LNFLEIKKALEIIYFENSLYIFFPCFIEFFRNKKDLWIIYFEKIPSVFCRIVLNFLCIKKSIFGINKISKDYVLELRSNFYIIKIKLRSNG